VAHSTFNGPIRIGQVANYGTAQAIRTQDIAVTATANTDIQVPMGKCKILTMLAFTSTAFGAATDATLQVGTTQGGSDYIAAVSIKAAGKVALTFAAALAAFPTIADGTTLWVRIVQTGTASATGAATLVIEYLPLD
jgi:hypothetical protein